MKWKLNRDSGCPRMIFPGGQILQIALIYYKKEELQLNHECFISSSYQLFCFFFFGRNGLLYDVPEVDVGLSVMIMFHYQSQTWFMCLSDTTRRKTNCDDAILSRSRLTTHQKRTGKAEARTWKRWLEHQSRLLTLSWTDSDDQSDPYIILQSLGFHTHTHAQERQPTKCTSCRLASWFWALWAPFQTGFMWSFCPPTPHLPNRKVSLTLKGEGDLWPGYASLVVKDISRKIKPPL